MPTAKTDRQGCPALDDDALAASASAIDVFVKAAGGREALLDALAVGSDHPDVDQIVRLLLDPRYDRLPLKRLCQLAGLTVVDLFAAYKRAMFAAAHLLAAKVITDRLLPVVEDVMRRAAPYEVPCVECGSLGTVTDPEKPDAAPTRCLACAGHGRVLCHPDLDRQKLALEVAQLVQKSTGLTLQQNTVVVPPGGAPTAYGPTLLALQQAAHKILSGPRAPLPDPPAVVEAEIVEVSPGS